MALFIRTYTKYPLNVWSYGTHTMKFDMLKHIFLNEYEPLD